jgi:hypothetical protein
MQGKASRNQVRGYAYEDDVDLSTLGDLEPSPAQNNGRINTSGLVLPVWP